MSPSVVDDKGHAEWLKTWELNQKKAEKEKNELIDSYEWFSSMVDSHNENDIKVTCPFCGWKSYVHLFGYAKGRAKIEKGCASCQADFVVYVKIQVGTVPPELQESENG